MTHDELNDKCCSNCKGWDKPCPIALMVSWNSNRETLPDGVEDLIDEVFLDKGECRMFEIFKQQLELTEDEKSQLQLIF